LPNTIRVKNFLKISALVIGITLNAAMQIHGQNLPMACAGSVSRYGVNGLNGSSDFFWRVYHIKADLDTLFVTPTVTFGRGDSIEIYWDVPDSEGGIYTFEVIEKSDYGCEGTPYYQDVVINTSTINVPFDLATSTFAACEGKIVTLDPGLFKYYYWLTDGTTEPTYVTTEAGTYQVRLVDGSSSSCSYNELIATINARPNIWLGNDTFLTGNQTLLLEAYDSDIQTYEWNSDPFLTDNSYTVSGQNGNQTVWVKVTNYEGCDNSDTINIRAVDYTNLRIPAVFTPNGDAINDKWFFPAPPEGTDYDIYPYFDNVEANVFNRWGKLVWQFKGDFVAWDGKDLTGKELPMDSYHYIIRFKANGKTYLYKGSITIIR